MANIKWNRIDKVKPESEQKVWYWFEIFTQTYGGFYKTDRYEQDVFYGDCGWLTGDVTYWMPRSDGDEKPKLPTMAQRKKCLYNPYRKK